MRGLVVFLKFELVASALALTTALLNPYVALILMAAVIASLVGRVLQLQRQQGAMQREIASRVRNAKHLRNQAHTDPLTGLANRLLLNDRFQQTAQRNKRNRTEFAVLMVDLDSFKKINDTLGHAAGDHVLKTVARRLTGGVRASDTVARLGGDEFVLLIESFSQPDELLPIGRKLIAAVSAPIALPDGQVVTVGASVGFALYPHHGTDINDLLHVADKGMYDCKISGLMELQ